MTFKIINPPSELQQFPIELKWKPEIIDYTKHHAYHSFFNQISFAQRVPVFFTFLKYFTINLGKRLINYELIPLNIRKPLTVQGYLKFLQYATKHIFRFTKSKYLQISSENGDLVLADCGAEYQHYTADITRTYPINGKFSEEQKEIAALIAVNIFKEKTEQPKPLNMSTSKWKNRSNMR